MHADRQSAKHSLTACRRVMRVVGQDARRVYVGSSTLDEAAFFIVHTLKQVLCGFDQLDALGQDVDPGSPTMAFYLNSIYNYVALLFLLNGKDKPMAGSVYPALERHGLADLLDPVKAVLGEPIGGTTFGEAIRVFRNKAIVHSTHADADLERIYEAVNMSRLENQMRWQELLERLSDAIKGLAISVARSTGRSLEDFGFRAV